MEEVKTWDVNFKMQTSQSIWEEYKQGLRPFIAVIQHYERLQALTPLVCKPELTQEFKVQANKEKQTIFNYIKYEIDRAKELLETAGGFRDFSYYVPEEFKK